MSAATGAIRPTVWFASTIFSQRTRSIRCPRGGEGQPAQPGPGAHLAAVTWGMSTDGLVPVARSHAELIAGGLAVTLESRLRPDANLLSTLTLSSFAEIASTMVPWLLVGGTLALHNPFDLDAYLAQFTTLNADCVLLPG